MVTNEISWLWYDSRRIIGLSITRMLSPSQKRRENYPVEARDYAHN